MFIDEYGNKNNPLFLDPDFKVHHTRFAGAVGKAGAVFKRQLSVESHRQLFWMQGILT